MAQSARTILRSLGEVADAMQALSNDDEQFNSQAVAARTAASARDLVPPDFTELAAVHRFPPRAPPT